MGPAAGGKRVRCEGTIKLTGAVQFQLRVWGIHRATEAAVSAQGCLRGARIEDLEKGRFPARARYRSLGQVQPRFYEEHCLDVLGQDKRGPSGQYQLIGVVRPPCQDNLRPFAGCDLPVPSGGESLGDAARRHLGNADRKRWNRRECGQLARWVRLSHYVWSSPCLDAKNEASRQNAQRRKYQKNRDQCNSPLAVESRSCNAIRDGKDHLSRFARTSSCRSDLPKAPSLRNSVHLRRNVSQLKNTSLIAHNSGGGTP